MPEMDPREYYAEHTEREFERLTETLPKRFEFEHTVATLEDVLPADGRVLDAGGGPGRYSLWFADRGLDVAHCDLTPELVAFAREKAAEAGVADRIDHAEADVRDLPYEDDAFDAVCCLGGVLNHVVDEAERERAVAELRRVARPGAPVVASVISRLGGVRYTLKELAAVDDPDPAEVDVLETVALTGDFTESVVEGHGQTEGWARNHMFRVDEFETLLESNGLTVETVVALEGLTTNLHEEFADADDAVVDLARTLGAAFREDRALADLSEHFLVVARIPDA
jgi:SAM-dependent methyltransferase